MYQKATPFCELVFTPPDPSRVKIIHGKVAKSIKDMPRAHTAAEVSSDASHVRIVVSFYSDDLASGSIPSAITKAIHDLAREATDASFG